MNVASLFGIQHVVGKRWNSYSSYFSIPLEGGRPLEPEALHGSSVTDSVKWFGMKEAPESPAIIWENKMLLSGKLNKRSIKSPLQAHTTETNLWGVHTEWANSHHVLSYAISHLAFLWHSYTEDCSWCWSLLGKVLGSVSQIQGCCISPSFFFWSE